jgi:hypothetical protein
VSDYPDIVVDPLALDAVQAPDTVTSQQLDISNVGETDLEWDLMESSGMPEALGDLLFDVQVENQTGNNLILG